MYKKDKIFCDQCQREIKINEYYGRLKNKKTGEQVYHVCADHNLPKMKRLSTYCRADQKDDFLRLFAEVIG